jgi:hypothetical protein
VNRPEKQAGRHQLLSIGFNEIQMKRADAGFLISLLKGSEEVFRVRKVGCEGFFYLIPDFVATDTDAWADGRGDILRLTSKLGTHLGYAGLDDPLQSSPPACMEGSHRPLPWID